MRELLTLYFTEVREGKYPAIPRQLSIAENSQVVLSQVRPYLADTLGRVRAKAYTIVNLAAGHARVASAREQGVLVLLAGGHDNDSGNAGLALDYLTHYSKKDFTPAAMDTLRKQVRNRTAHFDKLLKLAGYLELNDLREEIRRYTQPGNSQQVRWSALVSLSRMGDEAAAEEVMRRAKKLPVNDDVIYQVFPDLAYTRRPEAIAYMVEVMQSDEKNCMSADAEREAPIACGYRIMEQLVPVVEGYPLTLGESGDIETNDYAAALATVRDWFNRNKEYKILRDTF